MPGLPCEQELVVEAKSLGGEGLSAAVVGAGVVAVWKNGGETQALSIPAMGAPVQRVLFENVIDHPSVTAVGEGLLAAAPVDTGVTLVQRFSAELVPEASSSSITAPERAVGPRALAPAVGGGALLVGGAGTVTLRALNRDGAPNGDPQLVMNDTSSASVITTPKTYVLTWVDQGGGCSMAMATEALVVSVPIPLRSTMQATCSGPAPYEAGREVHLETDPAGTAIYSGTQPLGAQLASVSAPRAASTTSGGWVVWSEPAGVQAVPLKLDGGAAGVALRLDGPSPRFDVVSAGDHALALWSRGASLVVRRLCTK